MYQTVIILLVTSVITIITTIVTVRFTMTGRVLSQSVSGRFKAIAKTYGRILIFVLGPASSIVPLVYYVRQREEITRWNVFLISFYTALSLFNLFNAADFFANIISTRKRTTARQLEQVKALQQQLDNLRATLTEPVEK